MFAALGDQTRLEMMARLSADGPTSTLRLGEGTGLSRQAISKHLQVLAEAGLVKSTRKGRDAIWEIEPARLDLARSYLDEMSRRWDERLLALKDLVESDP